MQSPQPDPHRDEDQGPKDHTLRDRLTKIGGPIAAGVVLLAKSKAVLFAVVHLGFIPSVLTFGLSLWFYVVAFGWRFAVILAVVLATHELGHFAAFRAYGLPARLPNFIPFLGAYTMGQTPTDLEHDAYVALAGPLTGLGLAAAATAASVVAPDPFWVGVAYFSALINLFNMIPFSPFDGGRMAHAIYSPRSDPRSATNDNGARLRVLVSYLGTAGALLWIAIQAHATLPQGTMR